MRKTAGVLLALLLVPTLGFAQDGGIAIGPRLTFVRGDEASPEGSQRFVGGALRLGSGRAAIEIAMDYRSDVTGNLTERVKSYPIQGSLLLYPVRARLAPYLLGGIGWYTQKVTRFSAPTGTLIEGEETTREMGYHAGFGAELRAHRRVGLYGDYRYTMIGFGGDDDSGFLPGWIPGSERLKLSHEGSVFTWGALFYF
jgi:Outer membrane protein beta-barrel domain